MERLYYTAPSDEIFTEVKDAAIEVWTEKNSHPFYIAEKVDRIKNITNVKDNMMFIVAMFDDENMRNLSRKLSKEARIAIRGRMIDGGNPLYTIPF
jgi:hypothetical protein